MSPGVLSLQLFFLYMCVRVHDHCFQQIRHQQGVVAKIFLSPFLPENLVSTSGLNLMLTYHETLLLHPAFRNYDFNRTVLRHRCASVGVHYGTTANWKRHAVQIYKPSFIQVANKATSEGDSLRVRYHNLMRISYYYNFLREVEDPANLAGYYYACSPRGYVFHN